MDAKTTNAQETPKNPGSEPAKEEDVSDTLTKMCKETASSAKFTRIDQLDVGAKHVLFFTVSSIQPENVYRFTGEFRSVSTEIFLLFALTDLIVDDCQKEKKCRFLARLVPVEETCWGMFK